MKPSELPKNKRDSVRVNKDVDAALRKKGLTIQKLLDKAIDLELDLNIVLKNKRKK